MFDEKCPQNRMPHLWLHYAELRQPALSLPDSPPCEGDLWLFLITMKNLLALMSTTNLIAGNMTVMSLSSCFYCSVLVGGVRFYPSYSKRNEESEEYQNCQQSHSNYYPTATLQVLRTPCVIQSVAQMSSLF